MEEHYLAYLSLLGGLNSDLEQLTSLAQQKTDAVRQDDLMALDEVLKQEQAMSLTLRGLEQKRLALISQLGLEGVSLSDLSSRYPAELRAQAKEAAETVQRTYKVYCSAADAARITLECNLHEIEKFIASAGGAPTEGAGYTPPNTEPPKKMKTDFRA